MKNILTFYRPLKGVLVFAILGILMLTGCNDLVSPSAEKAGGKAGLQISISGTGTGARTLFPNADFVEYVLSFEYEDSSETHADVTIPGNAPSAFVTGLADGDWTITAVGYVRIDGTLYPAAEGSDTITVASDTFQSLAINIAPSRTVGEDGFFTWSVSMPPSVVSAELELYPYLSNTLYNSFDLLSTPGGNTDIAPGFYTMFIIMETADTSKTRSELIHIYSNMETRAVYAFTEDDFADFINLSGTLKISSSIDFDNMDFDLIEIRAWRDAYRELVLGWDFDVDLSAKTWSARIPAFDEDYTFYLELCLEDEDGNWYSAIVPLTVKNEDLSGIVLDFVFITLSGTVTVNDLVDWMYIEVYLDADQNYFWGDADVDDVGGTWEWEITGTGFPTDTTLYFWVDGGDSNGDGFYTEAGSFTVKNTDANIPLTVNVKRIELSGEITVIEGADTHSNMELWFGTIENNKDIRYVEIKKEDDTYSFSIRTFSENTKLYVSAYVVYDNSVTMVSLDPIYVHNSDISGHNITVDLSAFNTISGTVNYSEHCNWLEVNIYKDPELTMWIGSAQLFNATQWSANIPVFETDTTLYLSVDGRTTNGLRMESETVNIVVKDTAIEDIEIVAEAGGINSKYITLSGTLSSTSTAANRATIYVNAYDETWTTEIGNSFPATRSWTIQIPKFSGKKAISFRILYVTGSSPPYTYTFVSTNKRIILTGDNISGIELTF